MLGLNKKKPHQTSVCSAGIGHSATTGLDRMSVDRKRRDSAGIDGPSAMQHLTPTTSASTPTPTASLQLDASTLRQLQQLQLLLNRQTAASSAVGGSDCVVAEVSSKHSGGSSGGGGGGSGYQHYGSSSSAASSHKRHFDFAGESGRSDRSKSYQRANNDVAHNADASTSAGCQGTLANNADVICVDNLAFYCRIVFRFSFEIS